MTDSRLDLVLILTDQQRHDHVGWVGGSPARTPVLDGLARSGVVFTNCYSGSTTCVPARTALLTGLLDHRTPYGVEHHLDPAFFTLPRALRDAGYQTALIGKAHFSPMRADHGFEHLEVAEHLTAYPGDPRSWEQLDHYHDWLAAEGLPDWRFEVPGGTVAPYPFPPDSHPTAWVRDRTRAFLGRRDRTRPLFLVVSFPGPHPPVNPPEPYASRYDPDDVVIDPEGGRLNAGLPPAFRRAAEQADAPHRRVNADRLAEHRREAAWTFGCITQIDDAVGAILPDLDLDQGALDGPGPTGPDGPLTYDGVSHRALLTDPGVCADPDRIVYSALSVGWPMARRGPHKYIREAGWDEEVLFDVVGDPDETLNLAQHPFGQSHRAELASAVDERLRARQPADG